MEWSKLSKIEKRKSIARDVIANIKKDILIISTGTYCSIESTADKEVNELSSKEFQAHVKKKSMCEVCALGALFISDIIKRNEFSGDIERERITKRLNKYFTDEQLNLIENAFEQQDIIDMDEELGEKALLFAEDISDDSERLIGIMQNIINDPKGLFNPSKPFKIRKK